MLLLAIHCFCGLAIASIDGTEVPDGECSREDSECSGQLLDRTLSFDCIAMVKKLVSVTF